MQRSFILRQVLLKASSFPHEGHLAIFFFMSVFSLYIDPRTILIQGWHIYLKNIPGVKQ